MGSGGLSGLGTLGRPASSAWGKPPGTWDPRKGAFCSGPCPGGISQGAPCQGGSDRRDTHVLSSAGALRAPQPTSRHPQWRSTCPVSLPCPASAASAELRQAGLRAPGALLREERTGGGSPCPQLHGKSDLGASRAGKGDSCHWTGRPGRPGPLPASCSALFLSCPQQFGGATRPGLAGVWERVLWPSPPSMVVETEAQAARLGALNPLPGSLPAPQWVPLPTETP